MSRVTTGLLLALALLLGRVPFGLGAEASRHQDANSRNSSRRFLVEKRYLNLPVKNGAPKRWMSVQVAGRTVRDLEIELADAAPDFWVFVDLAAFAGHEAVVTLDSPDAATELAALELSDRIRGGENLYHEKLRPQFHFTSRRGWNNDPNGLVFDHGEYHLFYQHNPYGWSWGNMHWGHAVSPDLVHWQELGDALYPDELGTVFSGSAVVDDENTASFAPPGKTALVCIYTAAGGTSRQSQGHRFSQCLAFSTDQGRSWTKFAGNPVLPNVVGENRDPKVIWDEPRQKWIMALYLEKSDYALFSSPDLKHWVRMSSVTIPGTSECPEFFEMPIEGEKGQTRWVFYGGNGRYLVGDFDGRTFRPETRPQTLSWGNCFYASQTYNHVPRADGRRILIGWGQVNLPGMPFNQMMDFPVELSLRRTEAGFRLAVAPVRELEKLRGAPVSFSAESVVGELAVPGLPSGGMEIEAEIEPGPATEFDLNIHGIPIRYDVTRGELTCEKKHAPLSLSEGRLRLRLLVDRASIEIFAKDGSLYMPMGALLDPQQAPLQLRSKEGTLHSVDLTVYPIKSALAEDRPENGG